MKKDPNEIQIVAFRIGMESYGLEIGSIREIIMPPDITPVPGTSDNVKGIINLRGEIIPVVEPAEILNAKSGNSGTTPAKPRIIILDKSRGGYGIMVDEVMEVKKVQPGDIQTGPACEQMVLCDRMVKGIIHAAGRIIIYLDPSEILKGPPPLGEGGEEADEVTMPI
jgi:chemotaxis signal transduction protein